MQQDFGGPERWQEHATYQSVDQLLAGPEALVVIEGSTRPQFALAAFQRAKVTHGGVLLLDGGLEERRRRLQIDRAQPELASLVALPSLLQTGRRERFGCFPRRLPMSARCGSKHLRKNGHALNGAPRAKCLECGRTFILVPKGPRDDEAFKAQVVRACQGIRGIMRTFGVYYQTILRWVGEKSTGMRGESMG